MNFGRKRKHIFNVFLIIILFIFIFFFIFYLNESFKRRDFEKDREENNLGKSMTGPNAPLEERIFGKYNREPKNKRTAESRDEEKSEDSSEISASKEPPLYAPEILPLKPLRNNFHDSYGAEMYVQGMYLDLDETLLAAKGVVSSLSYTITFTETNTLQKIIKSDFVYDDGQHDDGLAGDGIFGNHVLLDMPIGSYRWSALIGGKSGEPASSTKAGNVNLLAYIPGECKEFVAGKNDPSDLTRINIVALGINMGTASNPDWNSFFDRLNFGLYFDTGAKLPYYTAGEWGWNNYAFFNLEPMKNYKNKFNVWYIDPMYFGSHSMVNDPSGGQIFFRQYIISRCPYYNNYPVVYDPNVIRAFAAMPVAMEVNSMQSGVLAHEYGHAMAVLADEYADSGKCLSSDQKPSLNPLGEPKKANVYWASSTTNNQFSCQKYSQWNYLNGSCFTNAGGFSNGKFYFQNCPSTTEAVACYAGAAYCDPSEYFWRPAFVTLMNSFGSGVFSTVDMTAFCKKFIEITGESRGTCSSLCVAGCPSGYSCRDVNNDGIGECIQPSTGCADADFDGICDSFDNCVNVANPNQADLDGDKKGDVCDNDADGDGFISIASGGADCKDLNSLIHPGASEICGNGIDEDCSGSDLVCPVLCIDNDKDGYGANCPLGFESCDDDSHVNPGVAEICDGVDNNCNGLIDDGVIRTCGINVGECKYGTESCINGQWTGVCSGGVQPIDEVCIDGKDNNCDGILDNCACTFSNLRWSSNRANEGDAVQLFYDPDYSKCSILQRYSLDIYSNDGKIIQAEGGSIINMPQFESFPSWKPYFALDCNDTTRICKAAQFYFSVSKLYDSKKISSNMLTVLSFQDADGDLYLKKDAIPTLYDSSVYDCDDNNPNVYPGNGCYVCNPKQEICNGIDDDCDLQIDNGGNLDCIGGTPFCTGGRCVQCTTNSQCDDNNLCTDDICNSGICTNLADNTNVCSDNLFCNGAENCVSGSCVRTPLNINDGIVCTVDSCDETKGIIVHSPDNTQCYDGLYCNGFEICDSNLGCKAGIAPICDDGIACTTNDCFEGLNMKDNAGQCVFYTYSCQCSTNANCNDNNPCTNDLCNPDKTCSHINDDTRTCNDNRYCTINDRCSAGNCAGDLRSTDDSISCTDDKCDDAIGSIVHTPINSRCDNGLYCDGVEACSSTLGCVGGTAITCSDSLACTLDSCNENIDSCSFIRIDNDKDGYGICSGASYDCNDNSATGSGVHPGAAELCNGIDDDCDNIIDEGCTCTDFGGDICTANELCPGSEIKGDGSLQRCCNLGCVLPVWNSCSECGNGLFNLCDRTECYSISEGCSFEQGLLGTGACKSCLNVNTCGNYKDQQSCSDNKCGINACSFVDGLCKNACIDLDGDGFGTGDVSLCTRFGVDCDDSLSGKDIYPGAIELCDGKDNQCLGDNGFGQIDENCAAVLNVFSPENINYIDRPVLLSYNAINADKCFYVLDDIKKDTSCDVNEFLGINSRLSSGAHKIIIGAEKPFGSINKTIYFSIDYINKYLVIYNEFYGKGQTTNLNGLSDIDLQNVSLILHIPGSGKIEFFGNVNLTKSADLADRINLDDNVNISIKRIEVNSFSLNELNRKARLNFEGISFNQPKIKRDGSDCTSCVVESYSSGTLIVNVTGFSVYTVEEGQVQTPPSGQPSNGGSSGGGSSSGGDVIVAKKNDTKVENTTVNVIVQNENEEIKKIELSDNAELWKINNGEKISFQLNGSDIIYVILFEIINGKVKINVIKDNKVYDVNRENILSFSIGDREVYLGITEQENTNAVLAFGLDRENVREEVFGGIAKARAITYVLISVVVLLIGAISFLIYVYWKIK